MRCDAGAAPLAAGLLMLANGAVAADYHPIAVDADGHTVTLTGHELTIEQVVEVARHGARVTYSADAMRQAAEARDLKAEAGAENIPVYGLNRGSGALREVKHTPDKPADTQVLPLSGGGALPEIQDEDLVRAVLVVLANTAPLGAGQPEFMQMLLDLLNDQITPVAYSRGTLGEADFPAVSNNIAAVMSGPRRGLLPRDAHGRCARAGIGAVEAHHVCGGFGGGGAENAYGDARAALLVADGQHALEWADLIYALDKIGLNSSLTPMVTPVQAERPFPWVNWDAARIMDMLKGSFLFDDDPKRILQDPAEHASGLRAPRGCLGSVGQIARQRSAADQFLGLESHGDRRRLTHGLLGIVDPADDALLRQGRTVESWSARLRVLDRKLGPLPARQRYRSVHQRHGQHGYRRCTADREVHRPRSHGLLHGDQTRRGAHARATQEIPCAVRAFLGVHGSVAGDSKSVADLTAGGHRGRRRGGRYRIACHD